MWENNREELWNQMIEIREMRILVRRLQHSYVNYVVFILHGCSFWSFRTNIQNTINHVLPAVPLEPCIIWLLRRRSGAKYLPLGLLGCSVQHHHLLYVYTWLPSFFLFCSLFKPFSQWQLTYCEEKGIYMHMHTHHTLSEGVDVWFWANLAGFYVFLFH